MQPLTPPLLDSGLVWRGPKVVREPDPRQGELCLNLTDRCENESDLSTTSAASTEARPANPLSKKGRLNDRMRFMFGKTRYLVMSKATRTLVSAL